MTLVLCRFFSLVIVYQKNNATVSINISNLTNFCSNYRQEEYDQYSQSH